LALPLLLAGPIVRRVESSLASVWLALSQPASVTLKVWEGTTTAGQPNPFATGDTVTTLRVGDKLHLALATVKFGEAAGKTFAPDTIYSYDLDIKVDASTHTLQSLNMLRDATASESPDELDHVALGYQPDMLPSFATCPSKITDLRIVYGSCRRPNHRDPDALAFVDDYVREHVTTASERPHQLILGGDQIYADDVDTLMMLGLMDLAAELIGVVNPGDVLERTTVEKIRVDHVMKRTANPDDTDSITVANAHEAYTLDDTVPVADRRLPIDKEAFPPGRRLELTKRSAQFTSQDGTNHVISLGEFAALYLMVWSNACWRDEIPGATLGPPPTESFPQPDREQLKWSSQPNKELTIALPSPIFPARVPQHLYPAPRQPQKPRSVEQQEEDERKRQRGLRRSHRHHAAFLAGLPRVRRALANIPTYMMLDDHELTDDLFLSPTWRDRVITTALGVTILTNGMLAYGLFQDWGNDPRRYESGLPKELLEKAAALYPAGATDGPAKEPFERLSVLFGHNLGNEPDNTGGFKGVNPPLHWTFTVDAPTHRVLAIDNRTRRSYPSKLGPPGNVDVEAMADQIPQPPLPAGEQVLVVVAPLQVIGPPVIDDLVAPASFRVFDLVIAADDEYNTSDLAPNSPTGLRQMFGTNPDAIETWAIDAPTFEQLLKRLEPYQRVVLLSGDVHNSASSAMSYWKGTATRPARFVQFTSSGFKNVMPAMITAVDRSAAFAQQMVRANLGTERLGWDRPKDDMVLMPEGLTLADLVPVMRNRLDDTPVLLPTWGWPDDNPEKTPPDQRDETKSSRINPAAPPDWRWRVKPLLDSRPDVARPEPIRPLEIDYDEIDQQLNADATVADAYQTIAARHQHALGHLRNARQILFRANFGVVRFNDLGGGVIEAVHELYTTFVDPDSPVAAPPKVEPYVVHKASLGPLDEAPPSRLRATAVEVPQRVPAAPNG
jgi:hypothetical protein